MILMSDDDEEGWTMMMMSGDDDVEMAAWRWHRAAVMTTMAGGVENGVVESMVMTMKARREMEGFN